MQETGRESISTSDQQGSSAGRTDSIGGGDGEGEMREDLYEEAFARMKKAAGVSGTANCNLTKKKGFQGSKTQQVV